VVMQVERKAAVKKRLIELAQEHRLREDDVIAEARNPASVLHGEFEWDLSKAAYRHWVERARDLIQLVKYEVVVNNAVMVVPYYVRDPDREPSEQGYITMAKVMSERDLSRRELKIECQRALSVLHRAETFVVVLDEYNTELREALAAVTRIVTRIERAEQREAKKKEDKKKPKQPKKS
jgi:hypothetical protein